MRKHLQLSAAGLLIAGLITGSAAPVRAQQLVDDDARFDLRTGLSGFVGGGAALVSVNGNRFYAPDVSLGLGGQWTTAAMYAVFSVATGETDQGPRMTLLSGGFLMQTRQSRLRVGLGLQTYLWLFERPTTDDSSTYVGIGVTGLVSYDVVTWTDGEIYLGVGGRVGLLGTDVEMLSAFANAGVRW